MSKNIIVTGASRGIGYAILERFASEGWNIAFCSKNKSSVSKAKETLAKKYNTIKILAEVCDMSDKNAVISFAQQCKNEMKSIDILVNNAGIYTPGTISSNSYDDNLEEMMKLNLYSAYWMGKALIPTMVEAKTGHIVSIASIAGLEAYPNGGSYAITKFALQGYIRTIREELKDKNIRVTGIYPGATLTDSWAASELPPSRFIQPSDIAEIVYSSHSLSTSAVVEDIVIRPQLGDI